MNRPISEGGRAKLNRPNCERKLGDSNPRYGNPHGSLANCWFQPLTQTSFRCITVALALKCGAKVMLFSDTCKFLGIYFLFFSKKQ